MYTERSFHSIYLDYRNSGLSIPAYCSKEGLSTSTFYYWQNKLKSQQGPQPAFVPVQLDAASIHTTGQPTALATTKPTASKQPSPSSQALCCEISYPNGICVKINGHLELEVLRSLLILMHQ
jgi:hypothetical protein